MPPAAEAEPADSENPLIDDAAVAAPERPPFDPAEKLLIDNVTGLLNMHTAKNPYAFGPDEIAKIKHYAPRPSWSRKPSCTGSSAKARRSTRCALSSP
jgi:hypothetical protein